MRLRLAEYKNGKFERFLELTDADLFVSPSGTIEFEKEGFLLGKDSILVLSMFDGFNSDYYNKDQKDPLNRFNGLFDGRTYGNGKFVLIISDQDDIVQMGQHFYQRRFDDSNQRLYYLGADTLGNLHKNPELFLKIHGSQN